MVVVWVDTAVVEGMDPMAEGSIRKAMVVAWMEGIINRLTIVLCCRQTALSQISYSCVLIGSYENTIMPNYLVSVP